MCEYVYYIVMMMRDMYSSLCGKVIIKPLDMLILP